eukprot:Sdes_comp21485_c0_seq1m20110
MDYKLSRAGFSWNPEIEDVHSFLKKLAQENCLSSVQDVKFSHFMDQNCELKHLREYFSIPAVKDLGEVLVSPDDNDSECVYLCGNSLGLMPKTVPSHVNRELEKWQKSGVEGHFTGQFPWVSIGEAPLQNMAPIVGAK